jgi:hypothetical protein
MGSSRKNSVTSEDVRENSRDGNLLCGACYCVRCHEECGVEASAIELADIQGRTGGLVLANKGQLSGIILSQRMTLTPGL